MRDNILKIRIYMLLILFTWGYFWGFRWLELLITKYCFDEKYNGFDIVSKMIIYSGILIISVLLMFSFIKDGIFTFKKEYINEIMTALTVMCLMLIPVVVYKLLIGSSIMEENNVMYQTGEEIWLLFFSSLVYAPIVEELICRAGVFYILSIQFKADSKVMIIIGAVIFSALHLFKMEESLDIHIYKFIVYCFLGGVCGYVYRKTDNILCAIITHLLWNTYTLIGNIVKYVL